MKMLSGVVGVIGVIAIYMLVKNNSIPDNLGVNNGRLAKLSNKPNAVSSQTDEKDKRVEALKFKGNLENSKNEIYKAIEKYGNAKTVRNEKNYLYVIFTTGKMKYHDDVEFYFDESEKLIHFQSSSRVGYSDLGQNRERYNKLKEFYYK